MLISLLLILFGLLALVVGSDLSIKHGQKLAYRLGFKPEVVGLTVLAIGTSLPEIVTNVFAGFATNAGNDASGIAVGNIIGSCLVNITFILGTVAIFSRFTLNNKIITKNGFWMIGALAIASLFSLDGVISRIDGIILLAVFVFYLFFISRSERISQEEKENSKCDAQQASDNALLSLILVSAGLGALFIGASLIVNNGVEIAQNYGINEIIIGLFVGVGTSLPELAVSLYAIRNMQNCISATNIFGSNVANPLLALGAGAVIANVAVERSVLLFDIPFWLVGTLMGILLFRTHSDINRSEGTVLILFYCLYIFLRVIFIG